MVISYAPIVSREDGRHRGGLPQWLAPDGIQLLGEDSSNVRPQGKPLFLVDDFRQPHERGTQSATVSAGHQVSRFICRRRQARDPSHKSIGICFPQTNQAEGKSRFPPASKSRRSKFLLDWGLLSQRDRRRLRAATNATPAIPSRVAGAGSGITEAALISQ